MKQTNEAAFESVIESHLLANGYTSIDKQTYDPQRAIFPEVVLAFIRETQPKEWAKLEALHAEKTSDMVLETSASGLIPTAAWPCCATASSAMAARCE